jgi:hypothetical protein
MDELIFEGEYGAGYGGVNDSFIRNPFQVQNISLSEYLKRFDISQDRFRFLIRKCGNLSTYRYMNTRYLAAALYIYGIFESSIQGNEEEIEAIFLEFIYEQLNNEKNFKKIYDRIVDEKKEGSIKNYNNNIKVVIFSYCYKIFCLDYKTSG